MDNNAGLTKVERRHLEDPDVVVNERYHLTAPDEDGNQRIATKPEEKFQLLSAKGGSLPLSVAKKYGVDFEYPEGFAPEPVTSDEGPNSDPEDGPEVPDVETMTVAELKEFLTEHDVDFANDDLKADLLEKARNVQEG